MKCGAIRIKMYVIKSSSDSEVLCYFYVHHYKRDPYHFWHYKDKITKNEQLGAFNFKSENFKIFETR